MYLNVYYYMQTIGNLCMWNTSGKLVALDAEVDILVARGME